MKRVLFLITCFILLLSCAEKNNKMDLIEAIKIKADKTTIAADGVDMVTLTAVAQNEADLTSRVTFTVNDKKLDGNTFKTDKPGTYKFAASLDNIESDEITVTATAKEATLVLTSDKGSVLAGNPKDWITFNVKDKNGQDITDNCDFFIDNERIVGNKFRAKNEGQYKAIAKRGDEFSNELTIQANKMQDIILQVDKVELFLDGKDKATFKVYNKDNEDLTTRAQIFINDKPIEGNVFVPTAVGLFRVTADFNGNKSNQVSITVKEPIKYNLVVKVSKERLVSDGVDVVSLRCINTLDEDRDLTKKVKFYLDGHELDKNYFNTTQNKQFKITAKLGEEVTKEEVVVTSQSEYVPTPRVYFELFTGTWCPYCPRLVIPVMDKLCDEPQVVASGVHGGRDKFATSEGQRLFNAYGLEGYPTIVVGRDKNNQANNRSDIINRIPESTPIGMAVYTTITGSALDVDMTIKSTETLNDLKWVVIIVEDKLIADQANAVYPKYGNPIRDMEHRYVYRKTHSSSIWGEPISLTANEVMKKKFTVQLDSSWKAENCNLFILITKASDNTVITAQKVEAGSASGY